MSHYGTTVWVLYVSLRGWKKRIGQENDLRPEGICWMYERVESPQEHVCGCHSTPTCSLLASLSLAVHEDTVHCFCHISWLCPHPQLLQSVFIIVGVVVRHP